MMTMKLLYQVIVETATEIHGKACEPMGKNNI